MRRPPKATTTENYATGMWRPVVRPFGREFTEMGYPSFLDISMVRNMPTLVQNVSTTDPFGPSTAQLVFPAVTLLDAPGEGDLWWLVGDMSVDLRWTPAEPGGESYTWEGLFQSFDWNETETGHQLTVSCQGALLPLGNFLATPRYPYQPIPYEREIAEQFKNRPSLRLARMPEPEWPSWWTRTYTKSYWDALPVYRRPEGMVDGMPWTGMLTRNTGDFNSALEHVQALLGNMFTDRGQFTVMLDKGRVPILRHRDRVEVANEDTLILDLLKPGCSVQSLSVDHSQKVSAVYASGTTVKGVTFNGMRVSPDGSKTWYEPYAARREVHPPDSTNPWWTRSMLRREVAITFADGASEDEATLVAQQHLDRYVDPGIIGTLLVTVDPWRSDGTTFPRQILRAGMTVQVRNLFGRPDGVLFHITEATSSDEGTSITIDSKYRDQLTVQEVKARTRDALAPVRLLTINSYAPTQQDALFPWSYARGSGYIPRGSKSLFDGMPDDLEFPWQEWTRRRPPKDATWAPDYMRLGPRSTNANDNWVRMPTSNASDFKAYRIRMSQAGEAKLLQVAAYDRNGNVLEVPFHVSFYTMNSVGVKSMPGLTKERAPQYAPYQAGQRYPFFEGAFESQYADGRISDAFTQNLQSAGLIAGWGNHYEKAGYWPGSSKQNGARPTGLLSLVNPGLTWNLTGQVNRIDVGKTAEENLRNDAAGVADIYVMIYCDGQADQEVFFLGRIFRAEQTAR